MTRVRLDQLPAAVRKRVEAQLGLKGRSKPSRAGTSTRKPCPGRCGTCGERFPTAHAWEAHADATGHGIWSIDL